MRPAMFITPAAAVRLRQTLEADLPTLNGVIERAVMTWWLPLSGARPEAFVRRSGGGCRSGHHRRGHLEAGQPP